MLNSQTQLKPRTITLLRGDTARLICSTAEPWQVMVWILNSGSVLTISAQYGILSNNPNVNAINCSTSQLSIWEFTLNRVQRSHQGQVTCDLQNIQRLTADLFVQGLCAFLIRLSLRWLPTGWLTVFSMAEKQRSHSYCTAKVFQERISKGSCEVRF